MPLLRHMQNECNVRQNSAETEGDVVWIVNECSQAEEWNTTFCMGIHNWKCIVKQPMKGKFVLTGTLCSAVDDELAAIMN